jgi:hypothetical protein
VASVIALRPAALSFRFLRTGAVDEVAPACFLAAAHLFRWAPAILERAAADSLRLFVGARPEPSARAEPCMFRSSAMWASMRSFCSSKPAMAAATISELSFVNMPLNGIGFLLEDVTIVLLEDNRQAKS